MMSMSVPNLKRIALFVQKWSQNFEIGSLDPGHAHLGVLCSIRRRVRPPSLYQILKRIDLFVQKLLGDPKFCPAADPLPWGAGRLKFNQLEMVTTFTYYKPSLVKIDARNFELSW